MKRLVVVVTVWMMGLAGVLGSVVLSSTAAQAAAVSSVSLSVVPSVAAPAESVVLSGVVSPVVSGRTVWLQRYGSSWSTVLSVTTSSTGRFSGSVRAGLAGSKTSWRAVARPTVTAAQAVSATRVLTVVKQAVSLVAPVSVETALAFALSGYGYPARAGRVVVVQRLSGTSWVEVGRTTQSSTGYSVVRTSVPSVGRFTYRAVALAWHGAAAVVSVSRVVSAHAPYLLLTPPVAIAAETVKATGKLPGVYSRPVWVQRRSGTSWVTLVKATTSSTGSYATSFHAPALGSYAVRALAPAVTIAGTVKAQYVSAAKTLSVVGQSASVSLPATLMAGRTGTATLTFRPIRAGRAVALQVARSGVWTVVATGRQSAAGTASFTLTTGAPATYSYRAFTAAAAGAPAFASTTRTLTVTVLSVGATTLISAQMNGLELSGHSYPGAVSSGGRYVAFSSWAAALPSAPQGGAFRRDTTNGVTTLIAADTSDTYAHPVAMSADANQVLLSTLDYSGPVVTSSATVRDLAAGTSKTLNVTANNTAGNGSSEAMALSADGRYAVFWSNSTNLTAASADGAWYVYQRDLQSGTTGLIGKCGSEQGCWQGDVSSDGRFVAYHEDIPGVIVNQQAKLWDRALGTTVLVSATTSGTPGNGQSWAPSVSDDGSRVVFTSNATDLVPDDTNGESDVFVRNMTTGATTLVTRAPNGQQADRSSSGAKISGDGTYVVFASNATNLLTSGPITSPTGRDEVYGRDLVTGVTTMLSTDPTGAPGNGNNDSPAGYGSWSPVLSRDGSAVAYSSNSSNIVPNTSFGQVNVLMRRLK